jgi:hypothetical protein
MRCLAMLPLLAAIPLSAHAGFNLEATPSAGPMSVQLMPYQHPRALPVARPPRPKPVALGYGHDVALASALREILPDGVQAQLMPAVDPDAHVDWQGGKPWDVVLQEAVKPLGIKIRATNTSVVLFR